MLTRVSIADQLLRPRVEVLLRDPDALAERSPVTLTNDLDGTVYE
jgi:hypothetical protein